MIKRLTMFVLCLSAAIQLTGCELHIHYKDPPRYTGQSLHLAVIGDPPKVREQQVQFTPITFEALQEPQALASRYDAVFITKEHAREAAESQYAPMYRDAGLPFFLVDCPKLNAVFYNPDIGYDDSPDVNSGMYINGFQIISSGLASGQPKNQEVKFWGVGLNRNIASTVNIQEAYSEVFKMIGSLPAASSI